MTEVAKVVNPKLVALADALKPVRSAAAKLLTINEKASEQDKPLSVTIVNLTFSFLARAAHGCGLG